MANCEDSSPNHWLLAFKSGGHVILKAVQMKVVEAINLDDKSIWSQLGSLALNHLEYHHPVDESAHQILSYSLLFSPLYHFPSTADPPTCTMPTWPSAWLARSPLTIPYTHCTIGLAPYCRSSKWPTDHVVLFPFLSSFSITWRVLS